MPATMSWLLTLQGDVRCPAAGKKDTRGSAPERCEVVGQRPVNRIERSRRGGKITSRGKVGKPESAVQVGASPACQASAREALGILGKEGGVAPRRRLAFAVQHDTTKARGLRNDN